MIATLALALLATHTSQQILEKMTLEEKVGQLFVVPACPGRQDDHLNHLSYLLKDLHVGGILLKQGTQKDYQKLLASIEPPFPVLQVGDAEWGVSMRVTDAIHFPRNLTLGAIQDLSLIKAFGRHIGWECRQVGIDLNLAPVADVNSNPLNPVIGMRSFGDDPAQVSARVSAIIEGMQELGVSACAKHFPDHGDVFVDSHEDLPRTSLRSLATFQSAIESHVTAVLTAHLFEESSQQVVTFSPLLVHDLLRQNLHFKGLIITDALNMGAISNYTRADEAALNALKAGHDLLLYGDHRFEVVDQILHSDVPLAIARILRAVKEGEIDPSILDEHVIRIIEIKQKLLQRSPLQPSILATEEALQLKQKLFDHAVTVVSNHHLPLRRETPIQVIFLGDEPSYLFSALKPLIQSSPSALKIICVMEWSPSIRDKVKALNPDILIVMTSPYGLIGLPQPSTLIVGYENDSMAEESVRKVLFGEIKAVGKLPVKIEWSVAGSNR